LLLAADASARSLTNDLGLFFLRGVYFALAKGHELLRFFSDDMEYISIDLQFTNAEDWKQLDVETSMLFFMKRVIPCYATVGAYRSSFTGNFKS